MCTLAESVDALLVKCLLADQSLPLILNCLELYMVLLLILVLIHVSYFWHRGTLWSLGNQLHLVLVEVSNAFVVEESLNVILWCLFILACFHLVEMVWIHSVSWYWFGVLAYPLTTLRINILILTDFIIWYFNVSLRSYRRFLAVFLRSIGLECLLNRLWSWWKLIKLV